MKKQLSESPQVEQHEPKPASPRKSWWSVIKAAFSGWWGDNAQRLGAALAFYTLFSVSPVLVFAVLCVSLIYGAQAAQGRIVEQLQGIMGHDAAAGVQSLIVNTHESGGGPLATALSAIALLFGASSAFGEMQSGLNLVWNVKPNPNAGWWYTIKRRLLTFLMVLVVGIVILGMVLFSSGITMAQHWISGDTPFPATLVKILNYLLMLAVVTLLCAVVFKYLPDGEIGWKDVWLGALVTAVLFLVGSVLIGLYLGYSAVQSAYGAAGSLVVFLLWTYYSAQIIYLGAEFTHAYACIFGSKIAAQPGDESDSSPCAN